MTICTACGTEVEGGNRFCTRCGRPIDDVRDLTVPRSSRVAAAPESIPSPQTASVVDRNPPPLLVLGVAGLVALLLLTVLVQNRHDVYVKVLFVTVDFPVWFVLLAAVAAGALVCWLLLRHRNRALRMVSEVREFLTARPTPLPPPVSPAGSAAESYQVAPVPAAPTPVFTSAASPMRPHTAGPKTPAHPQQQFSGSGVGWWGLACFFMGWVGGLVGYLVLKDSNPARARRVAIVGIIWSVVWFVAWVLFLVGVSAAVTP